MDAMSASIDSYPEADQQKATLSGHSGFQPNGDIVPVPDVESPRIAQLRRELVKPLAVASTHSVTASAT